MIDLAMPDDDGSIIVAPDENGDTFKFRSLSDGSRHRVLKNYFSEEELRALLAPHAEDVAVWRGQNFWSVAYRFAARCGRGAQSPG